MSVAVVELNELAATVDALADPAAVVKVAIVGASWAPTPFDALRR